MGDRLRYADAIALYEALASDPHTYSGASALGLMFPMDASDIVMLSMSGGTALLGDIAASGDKPDNGASGPKPTAEEIRKAESHMSSMFR